MMVVKVGGGKNINWDYIAQDLVNLIKKERVVLIHGASSRRDEIANLLNRETKTVVSPFCGSQVKLICSEPLSGIWNFVPQKSGKIIEL